MNRVEELIQQLCPNGVEWKKLGEVCEIKTGKGITQKDCTNERKYPVVSGGTTYMGYFKEYNRNENTVTISRVGANAGFVNFIAEKFYLNDKCFSVIPYQSKIVVKFLFYILKSIETSLINLQSEGGVPTINIVKVGNIEIPIPPLPIQQEIVRILDTFTELNTNLQTELEARKKQYAYYRDCLLNFEGVKGVEWKKLGEIGEVCMCKRIYTEQTSKEGDVPFYKIGTFGGIADTFIPYHLYKEYRYKYSFPKPGDILISASGTIGKTIQYDGTDAYFQDSNIVWIDNDENLVLNDFLFYLYKTIKWQTEGGVIKRLYNDNIKRTLIPIPPLSEQLRIINILDQFEVLVNDLYGCLPAELEARRKQYEYYRDKLLTFDRV